MGQAVLKRGKIVSAVLPGDFGKPRPVVIVQSDRIELSSVLVCPLTSELTESQPVRLRLEPSDKNGLSKVSDIMADKLTAISRDKCRQQIGDLAPDELEILDGQLAILLGFLD